MPPSTLHRILRGLAITVFIGLLVYSAIPDRAWSFLGTASGVEGSGRQVREEREMPGFSEIQVTVPAAITLQISETSGVSLEADDNLLPLIETRVVEGRLRIRPTERLGPRSPISITIRTPSVTSIDLVTPIRFSSADLIEGETLSLKIVGSGRATMMVQVEQMEASIAGSGTIRLSGKAGRMEGKIAGSGDIQALSLLCREATIKIAGSGTVNIHAENRLDIRIAGSGEVSYSGTPEVDQSVMGSGKVRPVVAAK